MTNAVAVAMTDAAFEFAALASALFVSSRGDKGPTYEGLGRFIGISASDILFFEIIGMIGNRAALLSDLINNLEDEYLDEDLRDNLVSAVYNIAQIISPSQITGQWNSIADLHLNQHDIRLLRSFSRTARHYRPLRVFRDDEQTQLLKALEESLVEIRNDEHYPPWALRRLEDGISRLQLTVKYFPFFGHDAVLDQLVKVQAEAKYTFEFLESMKTVSEHKLVKTVGVFALVANLILLPPKIGDAIPYYRSYIHLIAQDVPKLLGGPLKQITHQPSVDKRGSDSTTPDVKP